MKRNTAIKTAIGLGIISLTTFFGGTLGITVLLIGALLLLSFWNRIVGKLIYQLIGLSTLLLLGMTKGSKFAIVVSVVVYSVLIFRWAASYSSIGGTAQRKREKKDEYYQRDDSHLHSLVR